jgi:hypothetical protein
MRSVLMMALAGHPSESDEPGLSQGIPEKLTSRVNEALGKALNEYYATHPIYTLQATDAKCAAARLLLKDVTVQGKAVVVTLGL